MTTRQGTNRMAVPPPEVGKVHVDPFARVSTAPSPMTFLARVVFAAIGIVLAATLLLAAPQVVTVPILFVLAVGFLVSCVLVTGDGWLVRRLARGGAPVQTPARRHTDRPRGYSMPEPRNDRRRGAAPWRALVAIAVGSTASLLLALVAPERLGVVLAATGLLGLVGLRLSATFGGWGPHPARRAHSRAGRGAADARHTTRGAGGTP